MAAKWQWDKETLTLRSSVKTIQFLKALLTSLLFVTPGMTLASFDHSVWQQLLSRAVVAIENGNQTAVDYALLAGDRQQLLGYLQQTGNVTRQEFDGWSLDAQLAFLINVYNAWTVESILREWPDIDSIRDIGFLPNAAWRRRIVQLFGRQVSLDNVEHDMIRGWDRYQEPRIHFAVNCAAIGCPPLRAEAYTGEKLQQQLEDNTRRFLSDSTRNYVEGDTLYLSRIFDWYAEDFEQGWGGADSVLEFVRLYGGSISAKSEDRPWQSEDDLTIRYLDYDWGLNALRR